MADHLDAREPVAFNAMPDDAAAEALSACCASTAWVRAVLAGRPYASGAHLMQAANDALAAMSEDDVDEALAAHPRIGAAPDESAAATTSSHHEQAGVQDAAAAIREALAAGNREYERRFGRVYLVRATGRSADELLTNLHRRLDNDPATERAVVRAELGEINRIRLQKLLVGT